MLNTLRLGFLALVTLGLVACASQTKQPATQGEENSNSSNEGTPETPSETATTTNNNQQPVDLSQNVYYFDFDRSDLQQESLDRLNAQTPEISRNIEQLPSIVIQIEGHTDSRGSREYNLALGARRAEEASRALRVQGVPSKNLKVISFGEERPVSSGNTEADYSQNRRAEIIIPNITKRQPYVRQ